MLDKVLSYIKLSSLIGKKLACTNGLSAKSWVRMWNNKNKRKSRLPLPPLWESAKLKLGKGVIEQLYDKSSITFLLLGGDRKTNKMRKAQKHKKNKEGKLCMH